MTPLLESIDRLFADNHDRSSRFLKNVADDFLFLRPREVGRAFTLFTVGENLIRSAAEVEQVIGGITTRLWDDPFEWTLPEEISTTARLAAYLDEVESARIDGFRFFKSDEDLSRHIPAPEKLQTIFQLLGSALVRSANYQGRAFAVFQMFSDEKLPVR